uniref:F-box domain-containing protein n=1 Tax=Caenorhabditis tropicalis TaxID=1561998 RepID=A0A1I7UT64_9PELO
MVFALFRLPDVALEEVIKKFNPKEILFLTQTSLRARRLISRHRKSYSVEIEVNDELYGSFVEISSDHRETFIIHMKTRRRGFNTSWRFQRVVAVRYEGDSLVSRWKRKDTAVQEILDFLMEFFRIKQISFRFQGSIDTRSAVPIVENCISKNLKIENVEWPDRVSCKIAKRVLEASKSASNLNIEFESCSTIRFNDFHLFRMDQLEIWNVMWMTVENILALRNCKRIELRCVRLDESSINKILLELMENPGELQVVRLDTYKEGFKMEEVVKGLNVVRIDEGDNWRRQTYWLTGNNGIQLSVTKATRRIIVIERETSIRME